MLGEPPLGVTGVVAADVPVDGRNPLPARRCTQSIPLTSSSPPEEPVVFVGPRARLPKELPLFGSPGLSTLYFRNSR